jgi:hypothetical protein
LGFCLFVYFFTHIIPVQQKSHSSSRFIYVCLNESSMYEWQFVEDILNDMEWQRGACRMCNNTQGKIPIAQYIGMMRRRHSYTWCYRVGLTRTFRWLVLMIVFDLSYYCYFQFYLLQSELGTRGMLEVALATLILQTCDLQC